MLCVVCRYLKSSLEVAVVSQSQSCYRVAILDFAAVITVSRLLESYSESYC